MILGRIRSVVGVPFNPSQASDDVRSIFTLGFFDDVQLKVEDFEGGVKLTFVVMERPFVRDVEFTGNSRLNTADLQEKIDLKLGSVYNPVDVERAKEKIKEAYEDEGYFEIQVGSAVEKFGDGDVKVVFTVNEGRRITIEKIVFKGNKGLKDSIIKDAMITKERQLFILRGTVQRQKLEEDIDRIVGVYQDNGYVQMRVERYDTSVNRETARVTITIEIVEGPQYKVGPIKFTGLMLFPEAEVRRQLRFKTGEVFSRSELRDSVRGISDLYSTVGRASAEVIPRTEQQPATLTVDVTIEVTEGPEVYVERINISGQHPQRGPHPPPRAAVRGGRSLHAAEAESGPPAAHQPGLFRERQRRDPAGDRQDADHRERGSHRTAHRRLLHRRRLLVSGQLRRYARHLPEQLPGPGLAGGPADPGRRSEPAGDHQLHRALAVRSAAVGRVRPVQRQARLSTTTTTSRSGATSG